MHGDGRQTRCFIYVGYLAIGTALAAERPEANGEIFNIGTDEEISIHELALLMHELSGVDGPPQIDLIPYESFTGSYEDVRRRVPDLTKSRELLGFDARVDLDEGLERTIDWYRSRV